MSCHIRRSDCFLQCYLMTILHQSHQRAQDSNKLQILFGKRFATYSMLHTSLPNLVTSGRLRVFDSVNERVLRTDEDPFGGPFPMIQIPSAST